MDTEYTMDDFAMTNQITLERALELVEFELYPECCWRVKQVKGSVYGSVYGDVQGKVRGKVRGDVHGSVGGSVRGSVGGSVRGSVGGDVQGSVYGAVTGSVYSGVGGNVQGSVLGNVRGTINGREWKLIETPKEELKRLIEEGADRQSLLKALDQLEDSDD